MPATRPLRPRHPMPDSLRDAITARGLMDAYRARPPYQRNDYIHWITSPKNQATKDKRLAQMLEELAGGSRYMNMPWRPKSSAAD